MLTLLTVAANLAVAASLSLPMSLSHPSSSSLSSSSSPTTTNAQPKLPEASCGPLDAVPDRVWDEAAEDLLERGVATVRLSTTAIDGEKTPSTKSTSEIHSGAFRSARRVLDRALYPDRDSSSSSSGVARDRKAEGDRDEPGCPLPPMIPPDADSAHATGFHRAGGMSRYNARREGIVFSDRGCDCCCCSCTDPDGIDRSGDAASAGARGCHRRDLSEMFGSLHGIADRVLLAIERKLELPLPLPLSTESGTEESLSVSVAEGWFQQHLGPTRTASQWHMKRFVTREDSDDAAAGAAETETKNKTDDNSPTLLRTESGERITLPMHTDPSLISVVVHDSGDDDDNNSNSDSDGTHASERPGALGLQYYHPREQAWREPEAHGHAVATIFVGSVLAYLTAGEFPAAKHRVVEQNTNRGNNFNGNDDDDDDDCGNGNGNGNENPSRSNQQRMAATLFVRPQPSALLQVPLPSPWLLRAIEEKQQQKEQQQQRKNESSSEGNTATAVSKNKKKKSSSSSKPPITFDAWLKRVARNYEKQKKKNNNHNHNHNNHKAKP